MMITKGFVSGDHNFARVGPLKLPTRGAKKTPLIPDWGKRDAQNHDLHMLGSIVGRPEFLPIAS
jgi:hypothetical protein